MDDSWNFDDIGTSELGLMLFQLGDGIVSWNRGAEELYGWSASEAIGQVSHVLLGTRQAGKGMGDVEQILALEGRWKGELEHVVDRVVDFLRFLDERGSLRGDLLFVLESKAWE